MPPRATHAMEDEGREWSYSTWHVLSQIVDYEVFSNISRNNEDIYFLDNLVFGIKLAVF